MFEVPDGHTVKALVDFQTISPVPVAPLLDEAVERVGHRYVNTKKRSGNISEQLYDLPLCFLRVACDEVIIHVEEADPQQVEDNI